MTNERKKVFRYSLSFKQQVIREIEQEGQSIEATKRKYGINGGMTIQKWLRKFGKTGLLNQVIRIETMEERDRVKALEEEVKRLKLALADSLLAQRCLEEVIKEADKDYKTDLKKSFGESVSNDSAKSSG